MYVLEYMMSDMIWSIKMNPVIKRLYSLILRFLLLPFCGVFAVWCAGVVYYNLSNQNILLFWGWLVLAAGILIAGYRYRKFTFLLLCLELLIATYFLLLTPQKSFANVKWQTPWTEKPFAVFHKNGLVTVHNIRDFYYRTTDDYDAHYTNMTFKPEDVRTVDVALSHWDGLQPIAHTMLSFGFADGRYLVVSMETRLPVGAEQGFLPGIYKQYELLMVLGTENDLFKLRTNHRKEELYLYRTNASEEQVRRILLGVLHGANQLQSHPRYYNSLTRNCTTSLSPILRVLDPGFVNDFRLLLNGYSDELLFELGYLFHRRGETFDQLKARRNINQYTEKESDYSRAIRTAY